MASIRANAEDEDSEEDADFDMKSDEDDEGEPSDASEAESGDAEMIEEQPKVLHLTYGLHLCSDHRFCIGLALQRKVTHMAVLCCAILLIATSSFLTWSLQTQPRELQQLGMIC